MTIVLADLAGPPHSDPPEPYWQLGADGDETREVLHIGDEVALLSEHTLHTPNAYGRIVSRDPRTGMPVVLLLGAHRSLGQVVLPLGDILGRRVQRYTDQ